MGDGGVKWGCYGGVGLLRGQAGSRGAGVWQKSISGSQEASGMQSFGPQAETAPRHTPSIWGRPSLWLQPCGLCPEKFWLEGSLGSLRDCLLLVGITPDMSFDVR